jgi:hypothetical protein
MRHVVWSVLVCSSLAHAGSGSVQLEHVPFVAQKPDFCGEADVEMALRWLGREVTQDDVFEASGVDPLLGRGAYTDELARALRKLGVDPGPVWYPVKPAKAEAQVRAQWDALVADLVAQVPSIVCMHYDDQPKTTEHFRLVTGYDAEHDEVVYQEPAEAHGESRHMSRAQFLKLWTFKPRAEVWNLIRLRIAPQGPAPTVPVLPLPRPRPAEVAQRVLKLKETIPAGMTLVWESPFLVIGNERPEVVKSRGRDVVRWTKERLLKDFFAHAPTALEEVWIFKDSASYTRASRELFATEPETPYGYFLPSRNAMVMNIGPGYGTLTHELVHPFMHANWPEGPAWLNEGLGSLFERPADHEGHLVGKVNWRLRGLLPALKHPGEVPTFQQLTHLSDEAFYADDSGVHYATARYLCYWLQERGQLVKFVARAQELKDVDRTGWQALTEVLGRDPDALWPEWERFVLALNPRA